MNHGTIFEEGDDAIPSAALSCSGVRRLDNVIPFPRRANVPPRCPAASSSYSAEELDAFFTPIGEAMSAVVMRIRNSRIRIQATVPAMEEER